MDRNAPQCRQNSLVREQRAAAMRTLSLPSGTTIPVLGQDTWGLGRDQAKRKAEIAAFRLGLDLGMTLIDTTVVYKQRIYTLISTMLDNRPGPQYFPIRPKRAFILHTPEQAAPCSQRSLCRLDGIGAREAVRRVVRASMAAESQGFAQKGEVGNGTSNWFALARWVP